MEFRISDTFTDSLSRMTGDEQKAAKTTAFDLQLNPASPGLQFHKLDKAKDKCFWSVRVNKDVRLIVHKTDASLLLCYVDHHDAAYAWAVRRKIERHPKTGAAQLVEVRERVKEITVPQYVPAPEMAAPQPRPQQRIFANVPEEQLLSYGVPPEWLDAVHQATEDTLFELSEHLPHEAAEALLDLAVGVTPAVPAQANWTASPFEHPDAQRRFRTMSDVEELEQALEYPWEKWAVFLHPSQQKIVQRSYNGPARVAGTAGTGKTVVALHRAVHLAKSNPEARILVTTFTPTLAVFLRDKLRLLAGGKPGILERIDVHAIDDLGLLLYRARIGEAKIAEESQLRQILENAIASGDMHRLSSHFLWTEWREIVDAWQIDGWEAYRDVPRLGRKTRLGEKQRQQLWEIFERARMRLAELRLMTMAQVYARLTKSFEEGSASPYNHAVVDEAQDLDVPQLRLLAALGGSQNDGLFFAGDLGQRIFQAPFSWKSVGVDIRGRSSSLRINYRTSHPIRQQADRLLPPEIADVDGNAEQRRGTISVFGGPKPIVRVFDSPEEEVAAAGQWLADRTSDGLLPHEIAVFVRSPGQFERAAQAIEAAGLSSMPTAEDVKLQKGKVSIMTMHLAKGLEFPAVAVIACDDEILPLQERIAAVADDSDLEEVFNTERHLLYVACTRARDHLFVSGVDPASEFLDDLAIDDA